MNSPSSSRARYLVMGAGAIGSVIGGLLRRAGHDVWFCGREAHIEAIRRNGLRITGIWGDYQIEGMHLATDVRQVPRSEMFDYILLTVKSYDTLSAAKQILPFVSPGTVVVSLQNGLGNVEEIAGVVGEEQTAAGRVIFGAQINTAGEVEVTVYAEEVMVGSPFGSESLTPRLEQLADHLCEAGVPAKATRDIHKYLWAKLLYNACLNPMCTLLQCNYGYLLENEGTRELMGAVIREIFEVGRARGVALAHKSPEAYRRVLFERLIPATHAHYPSMWQDIRRGRRTEIDAMNGRIVEYGREAGIQTPVNGILTALIKALEVRGFSSTS